MLDAEKILKKTKEILDEWYEQEELEFIASVGAVAEASIFALVEALNTEFKKKDNG